MDVNNNVGKLELKFLIEVFLYSCTWNLKRKDFEIYDKFNI